MQKVAAVEHDTTPEQDAIATKQHLMNMMCCRSQWNTVTDEWQSLYFTDDNPTHNRVDLTNSGIKHLLVELLEFVNQLKVTLEHNHTRSALRNSPSERSADCIQADCGECGGIEGEGE